MNCLFYTPCRPALRPTQPLIQRFQEVKRKGREADHSPPTNAEVKQIWIYGDNFLPLWPCNMCPLSPAKLRKTGQSNIRQILRSYGNAIFLQCRKWFNVDQERVGFFWKGISITRLYLGPPVTSLFHTVQYK
jgi:hypothetical protein